MPEHCGDRQHTPRRGMQTSRRSTTTSRTPAGTARGGREASSTRPLSIGFNLAALEQVAQYFTEEKGVPLGPFPERAHHARCGVGAGPGRDHRPRLGLAEAIELGAIPKLLAPQRR